jgi:hydrogenase maturation protease
MDKKPILILGIGNLLLKDEGIGVHVVQRLMNMPLPTDVEVMDGGTMGLNLIYSIEGRKKVIVIDAVMTDAQAGTLYRFTDKDLEEQTGSLISAHDINFVHVLKNAALLGIKPEEVIFIGIKPLEISEGLELTPVIEEKIPRIIELVMEEISKGRE